MLRMSWAWSSISPLFLAWSMSWAHLVDPGMTARESDELGRAAAQAISSQIADADTFTWAIRAAPP